VGDFLKGTLKFLGWVLTILAVILVVLRLAFVDIITVGHNGMAPTIIAGDQVALWRGAKVEIGDIVLCAHPGDPGRYVLSRVIARAGQHVGSERGQLQIDDRTVMRKVREPVRFFDVITNRTDRYLQAWEELGNNEHMVFLKERTAFALRETPVRRGLFTLGDNRSYRGEDSRTYGEVDPMTCKGVVFMRLVPAEVQGDPLDHGWLDLIR
jgi:signal peptidase I